MVTAASVARADRTITGVATPDDHVLVIFGATGDLARRKLLPGLWHLAETGMMPDRYRIIGVSRDSLSGDEFRAFARQAGTDHRARAGEHAVRLRGLLF